jgi:hypothetical protein
MFGLPITKESLGLMIINQALKTHFFFGLGGGSFQNREKQAYLVVVVITHIYYNNDLAFSYKRQTSTTKTNSDWLPGYQPESIEHFRAPPVNSVQQALYLVARVLRL